MTDRYCLKNGRLRAAFEEDAAAQEPTAIFHLAAGGALQKVSELPPLKEGEGFVMLDGELYVEPLEIQLEFLKAEDSRGWLEALVLRHTERVRRVDDGLWVLAGIEGVGV